jgi:hypothetical protein
MHVGNLRSALYEFLIAKHAGGDFMLRIEDTDQERYVEGAVEIIYRTLQETGLVHDEGPDKDGGYGPYVQSERMKTGIYMKYAKELIEKGAVDRTAVWTARFFGLEGFYGVDYRIYGKRGGGQHLECVDRHGDCQSKQGARKYVYRALGGKLPCVYAALHAVCCSHCGGEA